MSKRSDQHKVIFLYLIVNYVTFIKKKKKREPSGISLIWEYDEG